MNTCPNFSDPNIKSSWDAITNDPELGRVEAMREFLLADQEERPMVGPEEIKARIKEQQSFVETGENTERIAKQRAEILEKSNDPIFDDPDTLMGLALLVNPINGKNLSDENMSMTRGMDILNKLSEQTGIDYSFITPEEAIELTSSSKNPYDITKGPAFFYRGTVYFIGNAVNSELAFHEFSHPIIKAVKKQNPILFEKLYKEALIADPSLLAEAIAEYADLKEAVEQEQDPESKKALEQQYADAVAEEILVKVLTKASMIEQSKAPVSTGFQKLLKDLIYAIKQTLRKVFGQKIDISKLSPDTTMNELAKMLVEGGNFSLDSETYTQDDVVAYVGQNTKIVEELNDITKGARNGNILNMIYKMYDGASTHVRLIMSNRNFAEMIDLFADEYNRGDLQEMRSNLRPYVKDLNNKAENLANEVEQTGKEVQALVTSMMRLEVVSKKIYEQLKEMSKDPENQDNVHKAYYYNSILSYWQKYIVDAKKEMDNAGAEPSSEIYKLLNDIGTTMDKSESLVNSISMKGVSDILWEQYSDMAERADEIFDEEIKRLEARKASVTAIDNMYLDYHGLNRKQFNEFQELSERKEKGALSYDDSVKHEQLSKLNAKGKRLTKEKLDKALKGEGMDANWYNSYLEGYLYNTDPIIGGFASYFKNNMTEMESRVQEKLNKQSTEIQDLIKKAGIKFYKIGELGEKIGFVDTFGFYNSKTESWDKKEVWTLLNPFKDYRYALDTFKYDIKELEKRWNLSGLDTDKFLLDQKVAEYNAHLRKYFQQEYVDDYYRKDELLEKDDLGIKAGGLRRTILNKIQEYQALPDDGIIDNQQLIEQEWTNYRLLYSLYHIDGKKKTGEALDIALRLQEHRDLTREFYEFKERPGVFQNSLSNFQDALFERLKSEEHIPGSKEFDELFDKYRQEWINNNTRIAIKPEFYNLRTKILNDIKKITSKLPSSIANEINFSEHWGDILDVTSGYRDDDGQPIGSEMPDGRKTVVRDAQQAMEKAKAKWAGFSGLTVEEMNRLVALTSKRNSGKPLTTAEYAEQRKLVALQQAEGLNEYQKAELNKLFAQLEDLQSKVPTPYYISTINHWLKIIGPDNALYKQTGITEINSENIDKLYEPNTLRKLLESNSEFEEWFMKNHIGKEVYNKDIDAKTRKYERLYIWNVVKPNDPKYYERTIVKGKDGKEEIIPGLPTLNYYARTVKKEFRTGYDSKTGEVKLTEGVHKDNRGEWLPKEVADSPYINEKYFKLKNAPKGSEENKLFEILEKVKEHHLSNQEGLSKENKLYFDFPRYEKSNLEILQTSDIKDKVKEKTGRLALLLERFKDWFRGAKDTGAADANYKDNKQLVRLDAFGDTIDRLPIDGLYDLSVNETSTDILSSMYRYMYGAEHHKQLVKMHPVAKSIKNILESKDNYAKDEDKVDKANYINRNLLVYKNKEGRYIRAQAFNNFYNREFEGQTSLNMAGESIKKEWTMRLQKFLFKKASFAFFALNIPSAIKNAASAKFQALIHAAGRNDFNHADLVKGEVWSSKYMYNLSFGQAYAKGPKKLEQQLGDIMDPVQGRFKEKFGESFTRTGFKDIASMTWLYNFRKWTELQASMQTYGAMMYSKKIKMGDTYIDYMNAWELNAEGQIQLKKGIDVRWGSKPIDIDINQVDSYAELVEMLEKEYFIPTKDIESIITKDVFNSNKEKIKTLTEKKEIDLLNAKTDGEIRKINNIYNEKLERINNVKIDNKEFKRFKSRVHGVMNKLNGAYSKFDQPEMQRYIAFRFVSFLKRYFTTMAMYRFGKLRNNVGTQDYEQGYYITAFQALVKLRTLNINDINKKDIGAFMKIVTEVGAIYVMGLMLAMLWGWDEDDEDRFEKLRARSGAIGEDDFDLGGFLSLHAMGLVMSIKAENEQFIPWFGYGTNQISNFTDLKSIAFGPTLDSYGEMGTAVVDWWKGKDSQFYKRDVGPYSWQKPGGRKLWNIIGKSFGLTGSQVDPATGITNWIKAQQMKK